MISRFVLVCLISGFEPQRESGKLPNVNPVGQLVRVGSIMAPLYLAHELLPAVDCGLRQPFRLHNT